MQSNLKSAITRFGASGFIGAWAVGMTTIGAFLMAGHWVVLPSPNRGETLIAQTVAFGTEEQSTEWLVLHILFGDCPCSRRVLRHVVERHPLDQVTERIVLIGKDDPLRPRAIEKGYETEVVTPEQLHDRYGLESAPLMVVLDRFGRIHYSGGYTSRKQGFQIEDVVRIQNVVNGKEQEDLPVYGCAVSDRLKQIIDPLGLKDQRPPNR